MSNVQKFDKWEKIENLDLGRFSERIDKSKLIPNYDDTYNYDGDLDFHNMGLKSLLEIPIKFQKVYGDYDCSNNSLISLEDLSFLEIYGKLDCSRNFLISLQYAPKFIEEYLRCKKNILLSEAFNSNIKYGISSDYIKTNENYKYGQIKKTVKRMSIEQRQKELEFFRMNDVRAFEFMQEILFTIE